MKFMTIMNVIPNDSLIEVFEHIYIFYITYNKMERKKITNLQVLNSELYA